MKVAPTASPDEGSTAGVSSFAAGVTPSSAAVFLLRNCMFRSLVLIASSALYDERFFPKDAPPRSHVLEAPRVMKKPASASF
jgi:hypothetical protein